MQVNIIIYSDFIRLAFAHIHVKIVHNPIETAVETVAYGLFLLVAKNESKEFPPLWEFHTSVLVIFCPLLTLVNIKKTFSIPIPQTKYETLI